jgi:hypothetical protein
MAEPTEYGKTPRHNMMQMRFLNPKYRAKFLEKVDPEGADCLDWFSFEQSGWDVVFFESGRKCLNDVMVCVEIKPFIGDEFPTFLRQIKKQQWRSFCEGNKFKSILLCEDANFVGVTQAEVALFFRNEGVTLLFEKEFWRPRKPRVKKS